MKSLKSFIIFAGCLLPMLYVAGCDIVNPIEGVKAILNTKARTTSVTLVFIDTKTDSPVGLDTDKRIDVKITGRDSELIIDLLNRPTNEFTSSNGFVSFAIKDEIIPDRNSPVEFTITAKSENYLPVTRRVRINSTRSHPYEINMVPIDVLPDGVTGSQSHIGSAENGVVLEEITFETPVDPASGTRSVVTIAAGTEITDSDGVFLSGDLSASFYHFSNASNSALASFPGGLSGTYLDLNNNEKDVFFTTAGFINLTIEDETGRVAKNFSEPLEITIETGTGTKDSQGNTISDGSPVHVWSIDTDSESGIWKYEKSSSIIELSNGNLATRFETDHLTYFNTGWSADICSEGPRVDLINNNIRLRGKLFRTADDSYMGSFHTRDSETQGVASYVQMEDVPVGVPAYLELTDVNGTVVETVNFSDLCDTGPATVNLSHLNTITVTFIGTGVCKEFDNTEVRPNFPAWHTSEAKTVWVSAGKVKNGELEITLPGPAKYKFGGYYEDEFETHVLDLNNATDGVIYEQTVEIPSDYCNSYLGDD